MLTYSMSRDQVMRFMQFLDNRIKKHNQNLSGSVCYSDHRMLVKTERAEAEAIRNAFLSILRGLRR